MLRRAFEVVLHSRSSRGADIKKACLVPFTRKEPGFALCGLNCCLCPRFHTDGASRCPGCGGEGFQEKHPSCAVVTCSRKHGSMEYCFECDGYPCERYENIGQTDSFITYRNVRANLEDAGKDLSTYLTTLNRKQKCLKLLIEKYNDGRSKSLYCIAMELLPIGAVEELAEFIGSEVEALESGEREKAAKVVEKVREKARELGIELALRK